MELVYLLMHDRALRRERRIRNLLDPLALTDEELVRHYRFPRHELIRLIGELEPILQRRTQRSHAIPTHTQLLLALRIYASGSFQHVIGDVTGPVQSSVSRVFRDVTTVLANKVVTEIKMPSTEVDLRRAAHEFSRFQNFPRVIGAIDCTHIAIKAPAQDEPLYINRKRFHSLNIQVVCNAAGLITSYNPRFPGSTHDAFIWRNSILRRQFVAGDYGDYLLVGDSGYPLEPFLMTSVRNPATAAEANYNRAHIRTRVVVERTFGILKSRFRCLHRSGGALQYTPLKCAQIVAACILLHNRCVMRGMPDPEQLEDEEGDLPPVAADLEQGAGRQVRQELIQRFR